MYKYINQRTLEVSNAQKEEIDKFILYIKKQDINNDIKKIQLSSLSFPFDIYSNNLITGLSLYIEVIVSDYHSCPILCEKIMGYRTDIIQKVSYESSQSADSNGFPLWIKE